MDHAPPDLTGSGRFALSVDPHGHVVKRGDADALRREALALRAIAGRDLGPELIQAADGLIVTTRVPGAPRELVRITPPEARALGGALRRLHDVRRGTSAARPGWPARTYSVARYRARRAADVLAAAGTHEALARRLIGTLPAMPPASGVPRPPFRLLHGDLVASNIVWSPQPRFVDFEFSRLGDPAEDLAYLAELNGLTEAAWAPLIDAYDEPGATARVDAWRTLCALDGAVWYANAGRNDLAAPLLARAVALGGA